MSAATDTLINWCTVRRFIIVDVSTSKTACRCVHTLRCSVDQHDRPCDDDDRWQLSGLRQDAAGVCPSRRRCFSIEGKWNWRETVVVTTVGTTRLLIGDALKWQMQLDVRHFWTLLMFVSGLTIWCDSVITFYTLSCLCSSANEGKPH